MQSNPRAPISAIKNLHKLLAQAQVANLLSVESNTLPVSEKEI